MVDPLIYFSFQPVLNNRFNIGRGMCYPVCGMVHIKEPLLLIGRSSPCGGSGFPLSPSEWFFTTCPTPYIRIENVLSVSLNKTFPSLLPSNDLHFNKHAFLPTSVLIKEQTTGFDGVKQRDLSYF